MNSEFMKHVKITKDHVYTPPDTQRSYSWEHKIPIFKTWEWEGDTGSVPTTCPGAPFIIVAGDAAPVNGDELKIEIRYYYIDA